VRDDRPRVLTVGPLELDRRDGLAKLGGAECQLSPKETEALATLMQRPGIAITYAELGSQVFDLRNKLQEAFGAHAIDIVSVLRVGWRLVVAGYLGSERIVGALQLDLRHRASAGGVSAQLTAAGAAFLAAHMDRAGLIVPHHGVPTLSGRTMSASRAHRIADAVRTQIAGLEQVVIQYVVGRGYSLLVEPPPSERLVAGAWSFSARWRMLWGPLGRVVLTPRERAVATVLFAHSGRIAPLPGFVGTGLDEFPASLAGLRHARAALSRRLAPVRGDVSDPVSRGGDIVDVRGNAVSFGRLEFDQNVVIFDGRDIGIAPGSGAMLALLASAAEVPVSRAALHMMASPFGAATPAVLDAALSDLAQLLRDNTEGTYALEPAGRDAVVFVVRSREGAGSSQHLDDP
jgi:hypothetical protein